MKSGLPIILKDNTYIVLYHNGEILYNDIQIVRYANQYKNSTSVILGLEKMRIIIILINKMKRIILN